MTPISALAPAQPGVRSTPTALMIWAISALTLSFRAKHRQPLSRHPGQPRRFRTWAGAGVSQGQHARGTYVDQGQHPPPDPLHL